MQKLLCLYSSMLCLAGLIALLDSSDCLARSWADGALDMHGRKPIWKTKIDGKHKVRYFERNGRAITQGDIVLGTVEEINSSNFKILGSPNKNPSRRWPNRKIPYVIEFSGPLKNTVVAAINKWNAHSNLNIKYAPRTNESKYIIFRSWDKSYCESKIGMSGSQPQTIMISDNNTDQEVVLHEMGHAAGLGHEHSRPDRDTYVLIHTDNIEPGHTDQFVMDSPDLFDTSVTSYDYKSIMHYPGTAFQAPGKGPTIEARNGTPLDNAVDLTSTDIKALNSMYPAN